MKVNSKVTNTTALAYIGDAVYEVYIRQYVLESGFTKVDKMNRKVVQYVCADGQAKIAKTLIKGFLNGDEIRLLKRGRNNTQTSKPRGSTPMDYKMATGFEALIGYLHLSGDVKRLEEVIDAGISVIEGKPLDEIQQSKETKYEVNSVTASGEGKTEEDMISNEREV